VLSGRIDIAKIGRDGGYAESAKAGASLRQIEIVAGSWKKGWLSVQHSPRIRELAIAVGGLAIVRAPRVGEQSRRAGPDADMFAACCVRLLALLDLEMKPTSAGGNS